MASSIDKGFKRIGERTESGLLPKGTVATEEAPTTVVAVVSMEARLGVELKEITSRENDCNKGELARPTSGDSIVGNMS